MIDLWLNVSLMGIIFTTVAVLSVSFTFAVAVYDDKKRYSGRYSETTKSVATLLWNLICLFWPVVVPACVVWAVCKARYILNS